MLYRINNKRSNISKLSDIALNDKADYVSAEGKVLKCADYLISTPFDKLNINREYSKSFLARWMTGTPDFTFNIDELACKLVKYNVSLLSMYLAYTVKYVIEKKYEVKSEDEIDKNVIPLLIGYCNDPENNVIMNDSLKEILKSLSDKK